MRDRYHELIDELADDLVIMNQLVGTMMSQASAALINADLALAEAVISTDQEVDTVNQRVEANATELIALQQPVASDLRLVIGALRISATLERMGDLARHVAKVTRMRYPESAIPSELAPVFTEMAEVAADLNERTARVIRDRDVAVAHSVMTADDRMDELHRQMFGVLVTPEWQYGVEIAVDITLLSRYYERFADHCVSIAKRTIYLVTGERVEA